ncbi:hypothetical protein M1105_13690 [Limibaculum sp. FT325]|uniref:hypothetical protein n=1 Tax=Thermohalobaculum sediminis TaxID=2939436 RepID=UPI0020C104AF|nr:hypothetical protein [Limibaculum sediminis]MCL5778036.1 hypothetical protein [Limibaculum sediminis]
MNRAASRLVLAVLIGLGPLTAPAQPDDYYYPPIGSEEVFDRDLTGAPAAERAVRVNFITQITKAQLEAPENPRFSIFAKGADADHMIIVALDDEVFATLYRARAVMAQLTSNARSTDFFQRANLATTATWFDLAKLLGFRDIVISDGRAWSHRIVLE